MKLSAIRLFGATATEAAEGLRRVANLPNNKKDKTMSIKELMMERLSKDELRLFLEAYDDGSLEQAVYDKDGLYAKDEDNHKDDTPGLTLGVDIGTGTELSLTRRIRHNYFPTNYAENSVRTAIHRRYGNRAKVVKFGIGSVDVDVRIDYAPI